MKRWILGALAVSMLAVACDPIPPSPGPSPWVAPSGSATPPPSPANPSRAARLQSSLDGFVAQVPAFGVAASVTTPASSWSGASGRETVARAMSAADAFRIASVSKTFCAALVLKLADEGKLTLDEPASTWLGAQVPANVTVRHLLSHTSGLPDYLPAMPAMGLSYQAEYTPSQLLAIAMRSEPASAPGYQFAYSNTNYIALGMIVEAVSAAPYHVVLRRRILAPLGLSATYLEGPESGLAISAPVTGTEFGGAGFVDDSNAMNPSVTWAAGGIVSTTRDLTVWFDALFAKKTVISSAALAQMVTPPIANSQYGLGMLVVSPCGTGSTVYWHAGSLPGFCTFVGYQPETGYLVTALSNTHTQSCEEVQALACQLAHEY